MTSERIVKLTEAQIVCNECEGTGKRWSQSYQGYIPSRDCFFCKGSGRTALSNSTKGEPK